MVAHALLARLEIGQLRNIEGAELSPGAHVNCLVGPNGSGKTSVLEAIHLLGRGRSFKTTRPSELIRFGQLGATVAGRIDDGRGGECPLGIRLAKGGREVRLRGRRVRSAVDLAQALPLLVIQPASVELVEGAPRMRRRYLDWGVFHVEHSYLDVWRRQSKALGQRNAALRQGVDPEPWDQEFARYGTMVAEARARYLARLQAAIDAAVPHFLPAVELQVRLVSGWAEGRALLDVLRQERARDRQAGCTQFGPHKGDFALLANGRAARTFFSRGQMKMLAYALLLAQARFHGEVAAPVCVLIDDLPSELDRDNRARLLAYVESLPAQCFITAVHDDDLAAVRAGDALMFHVEHGRVAQR